MRSLPVALALLLLVARDVASQIPGSAVPSEPNRDVECERVVKPSERLAELRNLYNQGNWHELQTLTRKILATCTFKDDAGLGVLVAEGELDFSTNYVFVVIPTTNSAGEPMVIRWLVRGRGAEPFTNRLPGIGPELVDVKQASKSRPHVFQVFLSPIKGAALSTTFVSTQQLSPLEAQIPDFTKAALDPSVFLPLLQGVLAPVARTAATLADVPPRPLFASLSRLSLPHKRAEVKIQDVVKVPAPLSAEAVRTILIAAQTARREFSTEPALGAPALKVSDALYAELEALTQGERFTALSKGCSFDVWEAQCWKDAEGILTKAASALCSGDCRGESLAVLERYKKALPPPSPMSGTTSLINAPLTTVTLGVMSGVLLTGKTTGPRAKVDGGKIAEDPLPRSINIVAVQFHVPHDSSLLKPRAAEQFRAFVGSVVTPSVGFAAGVGWAPIRNLSVNLGYAVMLIRTPKGGERFGEPPVDKNQPFESAGGHGAFFALGYKFK